MSCADGSVGDGAAVESTAPRYYRECNLRALVNPESYRVRVLPNYLCQIGQVILINGAEFEVDFISKFPVEIYSYD